MSPSESKCYQDQCFGKQSSKSPSSDSSLTLDEDRGENIDLRQSYGFPSIDELLKFCFGKKYALNTVYNIFERGHSVKLYSSEKWTDEELVDFRKLKTRLNDVKNMLNDYDLNDWHQFTRATNPADLVMRRLRNEMKVEFLTQAWCKVYELVSEYNLVPNEAKMSKKFYSIHLCEAPGAFVASLNHFLKSNYPDIEWTWRANSLNPFYEGNLPSQMINDDRFMMQTLRNWHFGPDTTGNIMHPDYPAHLAREGDGLAHLVTADGSFDCQDNPDEQESTVSWLHLKETLTALKVLREGGCFVIKMFTFFECETICLLYLLYMLFESLQVMKPATSKEGNSEVYVVCREFKGAEVAEPYLDQLYSISEETHNKFAMFHFSDVNRIFKRVLLHCADEFVQKQISVITRNIRLFERRDNKEFRHHFEFVQLKLWQEFVARYDVKPIRFSENIVPLPPRSYEAPKRKNVMEKRGYRRGSHAQRVLRKSLSKDEVFAKICEEFHRLEPTFRFQTGMSMPHVEIQVKDLGVVLGKPIEAVMSSQFCHGSLIRMRNEIIDTITIGEYNKFSQPQRRYDKNERDNRRICYFREIFSNSDRNYSDAQLIAFRQIYDTLRELKDRHDLVFVGFPLLTRFNINILCFLKQVFHNIELKAPFVLYMSQLNSKKLQKWGPELDAILRSYSKQRAVQSFFPIHYLTTGPLHTWLVEVNNVRVCHEIKELLITKYGSS